MLIYENNVLQVLTPFMWAGILLFGVRMIFFDARYRHVYMWDAVLFSLCVIGILRLPLVPCAILAMTTGLLYPMYRAKTSWVDVWILGVALLHMWYVRPHHIPLFMIVLGMGLLVYHAWSERPHAPFLTLCLGGWGAWTLWLYYVPVLQQARYIFHGLLQTYR